MRRDFRTDIFKRWNAFNGSNLAHVGNGLEEHEFNLKSLLYFASALTVAEESESTKRGETNWWGGFNNDLILNRSTKPTRQEKRAVFDSFFKKPTLKQRRAAEQRMMRQKPVQNCAKDKVSNANSKNYLHGELLVPPDNDENTL
jgi:hypothetical protein